MRNRLFANPQTLDRTAAHAEAVGITDLARFDACMASAKYADDIRRDMTQAEAAGVTGTPGFLLATTDAQGGLKVKRMLAGAYPFATFKTQIDALLAAQ